jgi:hypothetical protein
MGENTTGSFNVAVGSDTLRDNTAGSNNIFIGRQAGYNETGSNKLYIENSNSATPLIYGDFLTDRVGINKNNPTSALDVNGTINGTFGSGSAPTGRVLASDGSGGSSWQNAGLPIYDSSDVFIGNTFLAYNTLFLKLSDSRFISVDAINGTAGYRVLQLAQGGSISDDSIHFASTNCTGTPLSLYKPMKANVVKNAGEQYFVVTGTETPASLTRQSFLNASGICTVVADTNNYYSITTPYTPPVSFPLAGPLHF